MPSQATQSTTKSGIATADDGKRHIPSSVRADGTVRKEIKIRPGYRPPEDVEVYKNRTAEAFKNRGKGPAPGSEFVEENDKEPSAAAAKNAKKREARKRAAAAAAVNGEGPTGSAGDATVSESKIEEMPVDPEATKEKEAKKLAKKLRQAKELKEKKEQGGSLLPEQFEKVIRINELIRQLDALGFDAEGQRKVEAG